MILIGKVRGHASQKKSVKVGYVKRAFRSLIYHFLFSRLKWSTHTVLKALTLACIHQERTKTRFIELKSLKSRYFNFI